MKSLPYYTWLVLIILSLTPFDSWAEDQKDVFVVKIDGGIDMPQLFIVRRAFLEAEEVKADVVLIDLNTPGGRIDVTEEMLNIFRNFSGEVYTFANQNALSAGALLCLGSDRIYASPGSSIGSAAPVTGGGADIQGDMKDKVLAYVKAMVRGLAKENGYPELLAEAMVDRTVVYKHDGKVYCKNDELLNLTGFEAAELKDENGKPIFVQALCKNRAELLVAAGLEGATVTEYQLSTAEEIAKWITMMSSVFLMIGMLGLFIEFKTPGFGIPGITGIAFMGIFFFGHHVAGLANYEELALIILGVVLLALEIFVIPGFGIAGILGIACIVIGATLSMIPAFKDIFNPDKIGDVDNWKYFAHALRQLIIAVSGLCVGGYLLIRYLPTTAVYNKFALTTSVGAGSQIPDCVEETSGLVGATGVASTPLRPSGAAVIDGKRLDVITTGDLIDPGSQIRVVSVQGSKVTVKIENP